MTYQTYMLCANLQDAPEMHTTNAVPESLLGEAQHTALRTLVKVRLLPSFFMSSGRYTGETVLGHPCHSSVVATEPLLSRASAIFFLLTY